MTTVCHPTPPWPTLHHGHIRTGHSPKAPRTTAGLGSLRRPPYPHLLHPYHLSSSWGPETVIVRKTHLTRKRSLIAFIYHTLLVIKCWHPINIEISLPRMNGIDYLLSYSKGIILINLFCTYTLWAIFNLYLKQLFCLLLLKIAICNCIKSV